MPVLLETIQQDMYNKAAAAYSAHRIKVEPWDAVVPALDAKNVVIIPHCLEPACEDKIKELTTGARRRARRHPRGPEGRPRMGMKSLCILLSSPRAAWSRRDQVPQPRVREAG